MAKTEERDHIDRWMEEAWLEDIPLLDLEVEGRAPGARIATWRWRGVGT